MTRTIRLPIAPATDTTCGNTRDGVCEHARSFGLRVAFCCDIFRTGERFIDADEMIAERIDGTMEFTLLRWPECIAAEANND